MKHLSCPERTCIYVTYQNAHFAARGLVGSLFSILFFDVSAARTLGLPRPVAGRVLRISPPPANYP